MKTINHFQTGNRTNLFIIELSKEVGLSEMDRSINRWDKIDIAISVTEGKVWPIQLF